MPGLKLPGIAGGGESYSKAPKVLVTKPETISDLGWLRWAIPLTALALWLAGLPAPHPDDLFFGGAAIHLAEGHGMGNPWVGNWLQEHFQTDRFYVQLPYHTTLLGNWLRVTGVSTAALRAFALLGATLGAFGLADALRRGGAGRRWIAAACGLWTIFLLYYGIRADSLGLGLIAAGHLLLVRQRPAAQIPGLWLAGLGAASHPFALAVALPVVGSHFIVAWCRQPLDRRLRFTIGAFAAGLVGAAAIVGLGYVMIGGEVSEFLRVFNAHKALALPAPAQRWEFFYGQFLDGRENLRRLPFAAGAAVLLVIDAWRNRGAPHLWWLVAGIVLLGVTGYFLYAQYSARYLVFALFISLTLTTRAHSSRVWRWSLATFLVLATWSDALLLGVRGLRPAGTYVTALRSTIASSSHPHIVLDEFTVRYLYDFQPPARTRDWSVGRPAGGRPMWFPIASKPADELWVVSAYKLAHTVSGSDVTPRYLEVAGRQLRSIELGVDLRAIP